MRNVIPHFWRKPSGTSSSRLLGAGSAGSMLLAIAGGTCAAGVCGMTAFPVAALLSNLGLHALLPFLPGLRAPLILLSGALGALVIRNVNRRGRPLQSSLIGALLGGLFVFSLMEAYFVLGRVSISKIESSVALGVPDDKIRDCNADAIPPYLRILPKSY